jgi:hypothetical protein
MYQIFKKYGEKTDSGSSFRGIVEKVRSDVTRIMRLSSEKPSGYPTSIDEIAQWARTIIKPYLDKIHIIYVDEIVNCKQTNSENYSSAIRALASVLGVPAWIVSLNSYGNRDMWKTRFSPHCEPYLIKNNFVEATRMTLENIPSMIGNISGINSLVVKLTDIYDIIDDTDRNKIISSLIPDYVIMIDSKTGEIVSSSHYLNDLPKAYDPVCHSYDTISQIRLAELDKIYADPSYDIKNSLPVIYTTRAPYLGYSQIQTEIRLLESFSSKVTQKRIFDQLIVDSIGIKPKPIHTNVIRYGYHYHHYAPKHIYSVANSVITSPSYYPGHLKYFHFPYDIRTYNGLPVSQHCPEYIFFIKNGLIKHDQLMEFIDMALETKGYDFAFSFVRPLLGLTKINYFYFVYFLSKIYQSSVLDKQSAITDYYTIIITQLPKINNPSSKIHSAYLSVCQGLSMNSVSLMIDDPPIIDPLTHQLLLNTALDILTTRPTLPVINGEDLTSNGESSNHEKAIERETPRTNEEIIQSISNTPVFGLRQYRTSLLPHTQESESHPSNDDAYDDDASDDDASDDDASDDDSSDDDVSDDNASDDYDSDDDESDDDESDDDEYSDDDDNVFLERFWETSTKNIEKTSIKNIGETSTGDILLFLSSKLENPNIIKLVDDLLSHLITGEPELPCIFNEIPILSSIDHPQILGALCPEQILSYLIERGIEGLNPSLRDGAALILRTIKMPEKRDSQDNVSFGWIAKILINIISHCSEMIENIS